jgi:hypothetical protein
MKPLILILLAAAYASAQTPPAQTLSLADFARQERARQRDAQNKNIKVYTTEDIRTTVSAAVDAEGKPVAGIEVATQVAPPAAPAAAATPEAKPTVDPVQLWFAETEKLRATIRELIDREALNQLEINRITNEVYKPDTNETAVARARAELGVAQTQLTTTRELLAKARLELQNRETEGPPKK